MELTHLEVVSRQEIDCFVKTYMTATAAAAYAAVKQGAAGEDVDTSFAFQNRRIRANLYMSAAGINAAFRVLNDRIPTLEELYLPQGIERLASFQDGLVIAVGVTGSGKSTTLASIIDIINHTRAENIITMEDPIEYIYTPDRARIQQREIGTHTPSFGAALRGAMRQDPDVVLLGELRDLDTISNALTLAETGHLTFCTLHAKSVPETIDRIIDVFPEGKQEQIRVQLASVLRAVIHQKLVPNRSDGRVPLVELLMTDETVAGMIRQKQPSNSIRDYLRSQRLLGNVHIVDNVVWHCRAGHISLEQVQTVLTPEDYALAQSILASGKNTLFGGTRR